MVTTQMEEITRRSLLFDFYGNLLTLKQQEIYDLYYQQDLSLGEIAEQKKVSRQAIFDLLRRTEEALEDYEGKLGLVNKYQKCQDIIGQLRRELTDLARQCPKMNSPVFEDLLQLLEDNW
jgi:predicted DNA-binding protein YlxM (UPF0122 family)